MTDEAKAMAATLAKATPTHAIFRVVPVAPTEDEPNPAPDLVKVRDWAELSAPFPTLGGRLLALENETGFAHVAREV